MPHFNSTAGRGRFVRPRPAPALLGAAALLLAGCATAGTAAGQRGLVPTSHEERVRLTLSDWTPHSGMSCVLENEPYVLPEPAQLLDVARLTGDLVQIREALGKPSGSVLLSVGYGATGRPDRFHVVESDFADSTLAQDVAQLVDQRLYRQSPGEPFGVRLRVTLGEMPSVEVGRREACFPRWAEAASVGTLEEDPGVDDARAVLRADQPAFRVYMSPEGRVVDAYALGRVPAAATIGDLIAATDARAEETALLDRRPVGFWFTVRAEHRVGRHASAYGTRGSYGYARDSYCPAYYWYDDYGCDSYRMRYGGYGGYYGYSPYGYYGYGYGGYWGVLPWWYVPAEPVQPTRPPSDTTGTGAPGDTIGTPGRFLPAPHAPRSRPLKPVITAGQATAPARELMRRLVEQERAEAERAAIAGRDDVDGSAAERNPRTLPFRAAPDAGDVSTGTRAGEARGAVRADVGAGRAVRPLPEPARPTVRQREEPRLPTVHRPGGPSRATPDARPMPDVRPMRPIRPERPTVTRPAPTERRMAPTPSPSAPRVFRGAPRGGARPAAESAPPRVRTASPRPAPSSRPSTARPAPSSRPSTARPAPSARPSSRPSTARPAPPPRSTPAARPERPAPRPSSGGSVRPSSSGSGSSGGERAIRRSGKAY